jgi:hypothetical protein
MQSGVNGILRSEGYQYYMPLLVQARDKPDPIEGLKSLNRLEERLVDDKTLSLEDMDDLLMKSDKYRRDLRGRLKDYMEGRARQKTKA